MLKINICEDGRRISQSGSIDGRVVSRISGALTFSVVQNLRFQADIFSFSHRLVILGVILQSGSIDGRVVSRISGALTCSVVQNLRNLNICSC